METKKTVVLGVTGSIAAYKAADLASLLVKQGHDVRVILTSSAQRFITPLTLQTLSKNPVMTDVFDEQHMTPLHHAADQGRIDALLWLLERGADLNAHDEQNIGETPLATAVKRGQLAAAELLLKRGANPDTPGWMGQTARTRAAKHADGALAALFAKYRRT